MTLTITISITIAGWCVVHFLSYHRDRKKEWREFARDTTAMIDAIEMEAIRYHIASERNFDLERKIKSDIGQLDSRLQLIKKRLSFRSDVSFFRMAITLHNFQTAHFIPCNHNARLLQDISFHALQLKEQLFTAE